MSILGGDSLERVPRIGVGFTMPFLQKVFLYDNKEYLILEILCPAWPTGDFRPYVTRGGKVLMIPAAIPRWFFENNRVINEMQGVGLNETYVQAQADVVQEARRMFGTEPPQATPQAIPLISNCRSDYIEIQRLDYDGRDVINRNGINVRTFEHVLRITLKTSREMLPRYLPGTSEYKGDPENGWVHIGGGGGAAGGGGGGGGCGGGGAGGGGM